jgi:carboxyl-terminal processing protease
MAFSRISTRRLNAAVLLFSISVALPLSLPFAAEEPSFDQAVADLRAAPLEAIWTPTGRLIQLGTGKSATVRKQIENLLKDEDEKVRLGAAHALCQLNDPSRAVKVLTQLTAKSGNAAIRRTAAQVLAVSPLPEDDLSLPETLRKALKKEADPQVRLAMARALYRMGFRTDAAQALSGILSREPELRDEAVLALAQQGWLRTREEWLGQADEEICGPVFDRVATLRLEPTPNGQQAADLFREMEESRSRVGDAKLIQGERLLRELIARVLTAYPDKAKCDLDKLFEQAGKGLIGSLDPFSQYMDEAEVVATQEMLRQDYGGIGAYVGLRDQAFTILQPIYNAPAYKAGLRALDTILEVDGRKTIEAMQKGGITEVISKLKGKPGSIVKVTFYRRGFAKPVEVDVVRDVVHIQSVHTAMLPGRLGYIRLTRFGEQSDDEVGEALKELADRQGAKGLILDMRDNPGGLLRAAVDIADRFLAGDKLIVYSEGRESFAPRKDFRSGGGPEDERLPMVVLVNAGSASASEIVAGCLQDQRRATLVGEKTFGKGSVQQIIPLRTTDGRTQVRLTVAKYYLPSGRCIHERGVDPDIAAGRTETDDYLLRRVFELRRNHVFEDYARSIWKDNRDALRSVIEDDGGKTDGYPGFDAWLKGLGTAPPPPESARLEVRQVLRRMAQDEVQREYACDLASDEVLQRGALELLRKMGVDPTSIAQYKELPDRFKETASPEKGLTALPVDVKSQTVHDLPEK